jgi:hypothetical protein
MHTLFIIKIKNMFKVALLNFSASKDTMKMVKKIAYRMGKNVCKSYYLMRV